MNVKTLIFLCLCAVSITANCNTTDPPASAEQIHLHGTLDLGAASDDIEAYVDENTVYLSFHRSFGNVTVTLYNPSGSTIYSGVVNTAMQQLLVIPMTFSTEGTYTVVIENASGYADGDFEKQP